MIQTPICDLLDIEHPIALGGMGSATSSLRQLEQRRSRQQKDAAQIARALMDERNHEKSGPPEMVTVARKNGAGDAPELNTVRSEASRKSQNGHG